MNAAQVDIQQLRIKHILFKSKVRSILYGGLYDDAFLSDRGPINEWFRTTGVNKYGNSPELEELTRSHKLISVFVTGLLGMYQRGEIDQAHEGLRTLESKSEEFLKTLSQLEGRLAMV